MRKYWIEIFGTFCIVCLMALISSCTTTPVAPTPIPSKGWSPAYDAFVAAHLTTGMLSANPGGLCPSYVKVKEADFYKALVKSIAFAESGFDPADTYTEKFVDALTGKPAQSVGLLQLSVGDKLNYKTPFCSKLDETTIKDPTTNLGCGLEIMDKLIARGGDMQANLGKYWSSIRPGGKAVSAVAQLMPGCAQ